MVFAGMLLGMLKQQGGGGGGGEVNYLAFAFTKAEDLGFTLMVELLINDKNGNRIMGTTGVINESHLASPQKVYYFTEGKFYNGTVSILADGAIDTDSSAGWFQTGSHNITQAMIFYVDVQGLGINADSLDGGTIISWTGLSRENNNNSFYSVGEVEVYVPDTIPDLGDTYSAKSGVWRKLNLTHTNVPDRGTAYP